jgi:hypothetical protein
MDVSVPGAPGAAALAKLQHGAYAQAKQAAYAQSAADPSLTEHRQILRDLVGEIKDCVPFPVSIVDGNDRYTNEEAVIDIAPHDFELARLIEKLNWTVRFALTKGHGSATKMPDVLASRAASTSYMRTGRELEKKEVVDHDFFRDQAFAAAVLEGGNCGENSVVVLGLAQSLDDEMLRDLGVHVDLSKLLFAWVRDPECGHSYALVHHEDDGEFDPRDPEDYDRLWSIDSHQLYPMVSRYDHSLYNHSHADSIVGMPGPRSNLTDIQAQTHRLDLGAARAARQALQDRLGQGWADRNVRKPSASDWRRHPEVAAAMRDQGVSDYALIDLSKVDPARRAELEQQIGQLHRRVSQRVFAAEVRSGNVREQWQGLCLPSNPNAVYRNRQTGEILAPTVPTHYLERTETARWAWRVYQDPPQGVDGDDLLIPPAVQAIEQEPFLRALAGARALDFSANAVHPEQTAAFAQALTSLEQWVDRMKDEASDGLFGRVRATGLESQVMDGLAATQRNVDTLERIARDLATAAPDDSPARTAALQLRARVAESPARTQLDMLLLQASSPAA